MAVMRAFASVLVMVLLAGCAGSPPAPQAASPAEPTTAEEAQGQFEAALAEVDRGLGNPPAAGAVLAEKAAPGGDTAGGASVTAASPAPAPLPQGTPASPAAEAPPKADAQEGERDEAQRASSDPCADVCRALGSLTRAAEAICRIAGEGDERCARARGIVSDRSAQAARCACRR